MPAYYWETPPLTRNSLDRDFEFVAILARELIDIPVDRTSFAEYFSLAPGNAVRFRNLGGDATLVAPVPTQDGTEYRHLAEFLNLAPAEKVDEFWRFLIEVLVEELSDTPLWLSTSGLGVGWLHFRLDRFPKYYNYSQYR